MSLGIIQQCCNKNTSSEILAKLIKFNPAARALVQNLANLVQKLAFSCQSSQNQHITCIPVLH